MFCPQCGQQQATGAVRYCSRCGFPLDGVIHLLGHNGMLPIYRGSDDPPPPISARRRGVKQGGILLLSGAVIVPLLGILASFGDSRFLEIITAFAAIICFVGGPLRMLYAGVFEEGAPHKTMPMRPYIPAPMPSPQFGPPPQQHALPPPPAQPPVSWRRPNTAELVNPPSVTENTTRLLDKDERPE
jgi:hypothetical protein